MKQYKYPWRMLFAAAVLFIQMMTVFTPILHKLISGIFALLHIELYASPQTHLNPEETNGLNGIVIGTIALIGSAVISALPLRPLFRPGKKYRALMASAKPPAWAAISKKDMEYLRQQPNPARRELIICAVILLGVTVFTGFSGLSGGFAAAWCIIIGSLWAIFLLAAILRVLYCRIWQHIDETAQCAVLPVYRKNTWREGTREKAELICILPDGIYRFGYIGEKSKPCTVHVIRYRGCYRYIPR